ncbi:MAG: hypothetical protein ACYSUP_19685 [Planctomycetota bacterium]
MYSILAEALEPVGGDAGALEGGDGQLAVVAVLVVAVLAVAALLLCYLFYRKRVEHKQIMAAMAKGIELSVLRPARLGLVWITSLTVGVGLLIVGIGIVAWAHLGQQQEVYGKSMGLLGLAAILLLGGGISLVLYGLLRRKAERRALAIENGVSLSELERPRPIMSFILFGVCLSAGAGLLVRGCLLRRAERRYLSTEKGIQFSGRRRSKITKSILLGIGFFLLSLFFLYMVVEEYRQGGQPQAQYLIFFTVPFTLGVVFFARAALVRRHRRQRPASGQVDTADSKTVSD